MAFRPAWSAAGWRSPARAGRGRSRHQGQVGESTCATPQGASSIEHQGVGGPKAVWGMESRKVSMCFRPRRMRGGIFRRDFAGGVNRSEKIAIKNRNRGRKCTRPEQKKTHATKQTALDGSGLQRRRVANVYEAGLRSILTSLPAASGSGRGLGGKRQQEKHVRLGRMRSGKTSCSQVARSSCALNWGFDD